ncbi:MAG: hypothetical protein V4795_11940 [Pseudomonadota bacterium]
MTLPVGAAPPTEPVPAAWWDDLQTVPDMKQAVRDAETTDPAGSVFLGHALGSIPEQSTPTLLLRLRTVEHPLIAWALHMQLDAREVPPCLRPWMPARSKQSAFIATLADLMWLATRHSGHKTYERMAGVFKHPVRDDRWHRAALWAYRQCRGRTWQLAGRLNLTDAMRCHTLTMTTGAQAGDRKRLGNQLPGLVEAITAHGRQHPDKSGATTPQAVADRRALLVSTFVLLGRNQTEAIACLQRVDGITISRQTLVRQLQAASTIGDAHRMVFGSL